MNPCDQRPALRVVTRSIAVLCLLVLVVMPGEAATVTVINLDGPGEGFNDPTMVSPVAGNPGTTLGDQRLNAFQAAADAWGDLLISDVTIEVEASMDPLSCDAGSAVLGSAGTNTVHRDFVGAPVASTWYHQPLANSLFGADLSVSADVGASFNSSIDNNDSCLFGTDWWYGVGVSVPAGHVDFYSVVLHEIAHGLGVSTFVNKSTGARLLGFDDIYMLYLEDHSLGLGWSAMSDGQRAASATDTGDLHWTGMLGVEAGTTYLSAGMSGGHVRMYAPAVLASGSSVSHWDTVLTPDELMEPFAEPDPIDEITLGMLRDEGWVLGIFTDGFESGDTTQWSLSTL